MPYTAEQEITFEKTPRYFVLPEVPEKIQQLNPKMKLILIVCDPIRRAYSDFNYEVKRKGKLADMKVRISRCIEMQFPTTAHLYRCRSYLENAPYVTQDTSVSLSITQNAVIERFSYYFILSFQGIFES